MQLNSSEDFFFGSPCFVCKHYQGRLKCKAYVKKIPDSYLMKSADYHSNHGAGYSYEPDESSIARLGKPKFKP